MIRVETQLLSVKTSLVILGLMMILPLYFIANLNFNNFPDVFAPPESEIRKIQKSIREDFPEDNVLIALFNHKQLYNDDFLFNLEKTTTMIEKDPLVEYVMGITSNDHIKGTEDGFEVENLLKLKYVKDLTLEERKHRATTDHFAPGRIVSNDGEFTALIIRPYPLTSSIDAKNLMDNARSIIDKNQLTSYFKGFSGNVMVEVSMLELTVIDNLTFIPVTLLASFILLWFIFRKKIPLILSLLSIFAATNVALSYLYFADISYSMPAAMAPPLIIAMSIAFMIHLLNARLEAENSAVNDRDKMLKAINEVKRPIFYTMLTTILGLLSLNLSPVPPIQSFGMIAALGIFCLYFITIYLLPPLIVKWSPGKWKSHQSGMIWIDEMIRSLARFGIRNAGVSITLMLIIISGGIYLASQVKAETDFLMYFPDDHEIILANNAVEKNLSGTTPMEVLITGESRDSLKQLSTLKNIELIQDWLKTRNEVDLSLSMVDIIKDFHWAFNQENDDFYTLPENNSLIAQYLFIYDGKDLYDLVDSDFKRTRIIFNLNIHGTQSQKAFIADLEKFLSQNVDTNLQWQVAGFGRLQADIVDYVISGQFYSAIGAIGLIFIVMMILWRSVKSALLCLIPNLAPIIFIFSMMSLLGINLDIGTAIISSVALGIAVDDTIHIYDGYYKRIQKGIKPIIALAHTHRINGRAITATTIILSAQYFILATTDFIPTYQFGLMTGIGLVAALIFDIVLLPALLAVNIQLNSKK